MTFRLASRLVPAFLLCALPAIAQSAPCAALNDQSASVTPGITAFAFAGPTTWGYQYTPTAPVVAQAIAIFTGNTVTPTGMTLEIWSDDPTTQLPMARLAGGTLRYPPSLKAGWLGTNLDRQVVMLPSTPYWIAWTEGGASQVPTEPSGTTLPAASRVGSGAWSSLAPAALKLRIFCSLLDAQGIVPAGPTCGGSSLATAFANLAPQIGTADFAVEGTGFPSGAAAVLLVGVQPSYPSIPIPGGISGCHLSTDVLLTVAGTTGTGNVRSTSGLARHVAFPLPIPNLSSLIGGYVGFQIAVRDPSSTAAIPILASNALRVTVF